MKKSICYLDYKIGYLLVSILILMPSLFYLLRNKTIINFSEFFTFFLHKPDSYFESFLGAILFGILFGMLIYFYLQLLKDNNKKFRDIKSVVVYVFIISIIFGAMLPFTSSDVFHYMGSGRIDSYYGENPYYVSVSEVKKDNMHDEILLRDNIWDFEKVVYGPLWSLVAKVLSKFSFNNVTICMYIFKFSAILIHCLNVVLIYKITNKNKFALLYGINPCILFELIANVHNDAYLVFFILLALYFLLRKNNIILAVIFLALSVCIKYVSILVVPFLVLWYLRDKNVLQKVLYSFLYAVLFLGVAGFIYSLYSNDFTIISNSLIQQDKYRDSIMSIIALISKRLNINLLMYAKMIITFIFMVIYLYNLLYLVTSKNISVKNGMSRYNSMIMIFLFLMVTNLCPWYISWLFPTLFWNCGKTIRNVLYFYFAYELVILINFAVFLESYLIGCTFPFLILALMIIFNDMEKIQKNKATNLS